VHELGYIGSGGANESDCDGMRRSGTRTRMGNMAITMTMASGMVLQSYFDVAGRRPVVDSVVRIGGVQRQQDCYVVIRIKDVVQRTLCNVAYPAIATRGQRTPRSGDDIMNGVIRITA